MNLPAVLKRAHSLLLVLLMLLLYPLGYQECRVQVAVVVEVQVRRAEVEQGLEQCRTLLPRYAADSSSNQLSHSLAQRTRCTGNHCWSRRLECNDLH